MQTENINIIKQELNNFSSAKYAMDNALRKPRKIFGSYPYTCEDKLYIFSPYHLLVAIRDECLAGSNQLKHPITQSFFGQLLLI